MDASRFQTFGLSHWLALSTTLIVGTILLRWFRNPHTPESAKLHACRLMAALLVLSVFCQPLFAWLRHRGDPALAWQTIRDTALPFYLCDVVSLVLAFALIRRRQRLAELGYFWALAGSTQGLLTPAIAHDWKTPEFHAFFIQHGGAPIAALVLAFGLGLPPQKGCFKRVALSSLAYMATVMALNATFGLNYGFFNAKPTTPSLLDHMGPWPYYLITLIAATFATYLILWLLTRILLKKFPPPAPRKMVQRVLSG